MGGRYIFDGYGQNSQEFIDRNGNRTIYDPATREWTDTLGREIKDPLPSSVTSSNPQIFSLPGLDGQSQNFEQKWQKLKPDGCITGSEAACQDAAIENPSDNLYNTGSDTCENLIDDTPVSPSLFTVEPPVTDGPVPDNQLQWSVTTFKNRTCGGVFNPYLLTEVKMPDGSKHQFKYNRYGEMTKIIYPTGAYERFRYDTVGSLTYLTPPYAQTNRGVVERWVSADGVSETQHWTYAIESAVFSGQAQYVVTTTAPDNTRTERAIYKGNQYPGFEDPLAGMEAGEKTFDANGNLRSRTVNDWIVMGPKAQTLLRAHSAMRD